MGVYVPEFLIYSLEIQPLNAFLGKEFGRMRSFSFLKVEFFKALTMFR